MKDLKDFNYCLKDFKYDYIDDDNSDDEEFEHESDNFDSFYNEKGDFNGTDEECIEFLKKRRCLIQ